MSHLIFLWLLLSLSEALKEASEYFLLTEFLKQGRSVEATPKHLIIVDGAILQPIPEHPKRDFIFCLSTAFGDAYLFQAPCQVELDNWVNSIHSACAAAFARHRGKTGTLHLLQVRYLQYLQYLHYLHGVSIREPVKKKKKCGKFFFSKGPPFRFFQKF